MQWSVGIPMATFRHHRGTVPRQCKNSTTNYMAMSSPSLASAFSVYRRCNWSYLSQRLRSAPTPPIAVHSSLWRFIIFSSIQRAASSGKVSTSIRNARLRLILHSAHVVYVSSSCRRQPVSLSIVLHSTIHHNRRRQSHDQRLRYGCNANIQTYGANEGNT